MAGRFGAVQPTTRNGYLFGARRRVIPWESQGPNTGRRFQQGRMNRMAGQKDISGLRSGYLDAPQGVGRGFVPDERDAWDIEDGADNWETFDERLEPPGRNPYG